MSNISSSFPIKIINNDGITITLFVHNNMEIKEVKELYNQETPESNNDGIKNMELFFKGKTLKNHETIGECKIKPNNTLSLLDISDNIEAGKFK